MKAGTEFEGRASQMRKSDWLAVEDLDGMGDVTVTIDGCYVHQNVEFEGGRKEKKVYALTFAGKEKHWIINATNRRELQSRFGMNVKDWKGQKITLQVVDGVRSPKGGTTKGIRIK